MFANKKSHKLNGSHVFLPILSIQAKVRRAFIIIIIISGL